ncbi:MAG: rubrerythrin family protein [Nanoarchaeota archaeon]|nr:rubrerythrin family protein [Nanoarchaeota archaeon]
MKQTIKNLIAAYIGECQARARYEFYSKIALKEGYRKISEIFQATADQEKSHAKRFFNHIQDLKKENQNIEIKIEMEPELRLGDTIANLEAAIAGETHEQEDLYPEFARIAQEEGLTSIAVRFRSIAIAERHHKERFQKILDEVKNNSFFKKEEKIYWACLECGYIHEGKTPPAKCPSCDHESIHFERLSEEF